MRLCVYLFAASLLFSLGKLHSRLRPVQAGLAAGAVWGANLFGVGALRQGDVIHVPRGAPLEINHECTGVFVLVVYAMFVLAYPARWRARLSGILLSIAVLTTINLLRLVVLTVIASRQPAWFAYLHEYFFQGVFIALLALLASIWTEQVRRAGQSRVYI